MASCNLCHLWGRTTNMYNYRSCSVCANGRDRKLEAEKEPLAIQSVNMSLHLYRLNMTQAELQFWSEPEGFWMVPVNGRHYTRVHSMLMLNLHSWCLLWILRFSSEFPLCWFPCSLNSFSVFGLYISTRLQIIWRPHLWLVWSFTQMVSFLEFSTSNPVSPPSPSLISHRASLECYCTSPRLTLIITNNRFTRPTSMMTSFFSPIVITVHFFLHAHQPSLGVHAVVYQLIFEPQ